jgi:hypothetical protein
VRNLEGGKIHGRFSGVQQDEQREEAGSGQGVHAAGEIRHRSFPCVKLVRNLKSGVRRSEGRIERERPPRPRLLSPDALMQDNGDGGGEVGIQMVQAERWMPLPSPPLSACPRPLRFLFSSPHPSDPPHLPSPPSNLYLPFQTPFKEDENPADWYNIVSLLVGIANLLAKVPNPQSIPQPKPGRCWRG